MTLKEQNFMPAYKNLTSILKAKNSQFVTLTLLFKRSDCCVGTCQPLYFGFPENGVLALKHYDFVRYV
jgi:hypothetical protein